MKLTIESTPKIVTLDLPIAGGGRAAVPARVWQGRTEGGVDVLCYVTLVAARTTDSQAEFERELLEVKGVTSPAIEALPARLVL